MIVLKLLLAGVFAAQPHTRPRILQNESSLIQYVMSTNKREETKMIARLLFCFVLSLCLLQAVLSGTVQEYPPVALTSASYTVTTGSYGLGTYTYSASTKYSGSDSITAIFDKAFGTYNNYEFDIGNYNEVTGWYSANAYSTTTTSGVSYSGDYLQLKMPSPGIVLTDISIVPRQNCCSTTRAPRNFYVLGGDSSCTNWHLLLSVTDNTDWTTAEQTFAMDYLIDQYICYRVVVNRVGNYDSLTSYTSTVSRQNG